MFPQVGPKSIKRLARTLRSITFRRGGHHFRLQESLEIVAELVSSKVWQAVAGSSAATSCDEPELGLLRRKVKRAVMSVLAAAASGRLVDNESIKKELKVEIDTICEDISDHVRAARTYAQTFEPKYSLSKTPELALMPSLDSFLNGAHAWHRETVLSHLTAFSFEETEKALARYGYSDFNQPQKGSDSLTAACKKYILDVGGAGARAA